MKSDGWYHVPAKPLENGDRAIVLFYESDRAATLSTRLGDARYRVEDLWTGAITSSEGEPAVPAHAALMFRVSESREQAPPLVTFGWTRGSSAPTVRPGAGSDRRDRHPGDQHRGHSGGGCATCA
ncbi:hypothetical protein ACIBP6_24775 [Nonomuraea terrae]|uniref:hypothetical protein n=1 Tax=Nonomuraea terrae TaxID=2530383 RepID=UPI0037B1A196